MLEKYCDILVVGNQLPGLVTAAFLARRGLSVQVIDSDLYLGHAKNPDPTCINKVQSTLFRSILGRLNVPELTIQNLLNRDCVLQVVFPKHRIDISNNPLDYFEEIEREFPEHYSDIKAFYETQSRLRHSINVTDLFEHLIPGTWKEKSAFKKFIQNNALNDKSKEYLALLQKDPRLHHFFAAQYLLAYQQTNTDPFAYQISTLFNPGDGEIFGIQSGLNNIKNILHERITHYDGTIRKRAQLNSLLFRNGIFEGVEMDETNGIVLCKYIIWNDSLDKLKDLLPKKWRFHKLKNHCLNNQFDFHWFTARFSVASQFIPEPCRSNVLVITDPQQELVGDNLLYLQIDRTPASEKTLIHANFLLPKSALQEDEDFFDSYFASIRKNILQLMPFGEHTLELVFPIKSRDMPNDTLFPLMENDFEIMRHSAEKHGIVNQSEKNFASLFKRHYKTPSPNFYVSHPSVFAGFGLDANLMLGLKITDLIWQEVENVKKRAMKTERRIA